MLRGLRYTVVCLFVTHIITCGWHVLGCNCNDCIDGTWALNVNQSYGDANNILPLTFFPFHTTSSLSPLVAGAHGVYDYETEFESYIVSLYWASATVSSVGYAAKPSSSAVIY